MEDETLINIFAKQGSLYPNKKLIGCENKWLNYEELDNQARAICGQLIHAGVKKGDKVGIYIHRNLELPAIILGTLMSGGICLPLDPAFPLDQLKMMTEKTPFKILLTSKDLFEKAMDFSAIVLLANINYPLKKKAVALELSDGAYILFTSGTTRRPNAVLRSHEAIVGPVLLCLSQETSYASDSRLILRSPITHSPFLWELLYPLVSGLELIIATDKALYDPQELAETIKRYQVSHISLSPAHIKSFLCGSKLASLTSLVEVECSGEVISQKLVSEFRKESNAILQITYGSTEVPGVATHIFSESDEAINYIGSINENITARLLDSNLEMVPRGEIGELYLAGNSLASGYVNDDAETQKCFVQLESGNSNGQKITFYKTGDLARQLTNGEYEFLGRVDRQFQINSFRINPQEIESMINTSKGISESLVVACELEHDRNILVAYIILVEGKKVNIAKLQQSLLKQLPRHKVPTLFIPLDNLPRNQHHKIDHSHLISPKEFLQRQRDSKDFRLSKTEIILAKIWSQILPISSFLPGDDFFLLGGDSLATVDMLHHVNKQTGQDISINDLLSASTLRDLASLLELKAAPEKYRRKVTSFNEREKDFIEDPNVTEFDLPKSILNKQLKFLLNWQGEFRSDEGLIIGHHIHGSKPAIFWCCQSNLELFYLANVFGEDQPIYGIRSGVNVFKSWECPQLTRSLALHYHHEINLIQKGKPYILGGNCQGADIVACIADEKYKENQTDSIVIFLNADLLEDRPYPIIFLYGETDQTNPFKGNADSINKWRESYPQHTVDFVTGSHGKYFSDESNFADKLTTLPPFV